jgi:ribonuclease HI
MDLYGKGHVLVEGKKFLGYDVSVDQAEYSGLEEALVYVYDKQIECEKLYVRSDSAAVIRQLRGREDVHCPKIWERYNYVRSLFENLCCKGIYFQHIDRERNFFAESLAAEAIDKMEDSIFEYDDM